MKNKVQFKGRNILMAVVCFVAVLPLHAQIDLSKKIPGIQYEASYHFTSAIEMEMIFFNKKGQHQMTIPYTTYYRSDFEHFCIKHQRGNTVYQTLFDMPNNNCLIILGEEDQMMGSAAVMKDNEGRELKTLALESTGEEKEIAGYRCLRYTFDVPEFTGELWVSTEADLPNKLGVLKASKMGKFYEQVPVEGFVLEITSVTPKGKKTVMKTTAFLDAIDYQIAVPDDFGTAVNKIDYFDY